MLRRMFYSLTVVGFIGALALFAMLFLLTGVAAAPSDMRVAAFERWTALGISSYRATVRIEYRGDICFQQIEVRFGNAHALRNTCDVAWLSLMSVPELFELSEQIESIPPARCYPSARWCVCQRVFNARAIEFDQDFGYPSLIMSRSQLRPNWTGLDFWQRLMQSSNLPSCGPAPRRLTIQVLSLNELP
jgi:hypothetical protein